MDKEKNHEEHCQRKKFLFNRKNKEDVKEYENNYLYRISIAVETKENNIFYKENNIISIIRYFNKTLAKSIRFIIIIEFLSNIKKDES